MTAGSARRPYPVHEADLAARAAWLHFVGGLTQSEVARRLNVPNTRAHRYIARAQNEGLVRVFVDVTATDCVALENAIIEEFGLRNCRVAMDVPEQTDLPLRTLSNAAADFLMQTIAGGEHTIIGVGNGRTLSAAVDAMGRTPADDIRFVSVMGGLTRSFAANPYDVIHKLAQKTGAEAYLMPAPLFANSAEDKRVMQAQIGLAAAMDLMDEASLFIVGVGNLDDASSGTSAISLEGPLSRKKLIDAGARAEILGQFLNSDGVVVSTTFDDRVMAPALETLRGREVVAVAGGHKKALAIKAALKSGLISQLIIDESTARCLVDVDGLLSMPSTNNNELQGSTDHA